MICRKNVDSLNKENRHDNSIRVDYKLEILQREGKSVVHTLFDLLYRIVQLLLVMSKHNSQFLLKRSKNMFKNTGKYRFIDG